MEPLLIGIILLMLSLHIRTESRLTKIEVKLNNLTKDKKNG